MIYSDLYLKKQIKIPNVFGLAIVFFIVFTIARSFSSLSTPSKASITAVRRIETTNVSSNQAVIFWQTQEKELGWVIYGESQNNLAKTAFDDRDTVSKKGSHLNHYVTLKNLNENRKYFFKIISANRLVSSPGGKSFSFQTFPQTNEINNLKPVYGKIARNNGSPEENAVVILTIEKDYVLSTLTKSSGEFLIALNNLIDRETRKPKAIQSSHVLKMEILTEGGEISTVQSTLGAVSPLPQTIIVGENYDIKNEDQILAASSNEKQIQKDFYIIFPKNNSTIPASIPLIKGHGPGEKDVLVTIKGLRENSSYRSRTDSKGEWKLNLSRPLAPGEYSISASAKNQNGKELKETNRFRIAKSGEQVLGESTPSAELTDTPTPTQLTPSPVATSSASPTEPAPPVSGLGFNSTIITSLFLIISGIGLLLAF